MPLPALPSLPPASPGGGLSDIYLQVQTKRAGKLKGEVVSPGHEDDIAVLSWQWGLSQSSATGSNQATARRAYTALTVVKRIDLATTGLLAALSTNDEVKLAKLCMRRAGGTQEDYLVVKLESARVVSVQHVAVASGEVQETVAFTFRKVEVEYRAQNTDGLRGASAVFTDVLLEQG